MFTTLRTDSFSVTCRLASPEVHRDLVTAARTGSSIRIREKELAVLAVKFAERKDAPGHLSNVAHQCSLSPLELTHRMHEKKRFPTDGGPIKWARPFAVLKDAPLLASPNHPVCDQSAPVSAQPKKSRGRVDILRQTENRGGKTVTVVTGFVGIGQAEKELLAKQMQKACGAGGTVKEGRIEIQGDQRNAVARILTEAGFRPVFAGG
jgi:translation initiation factor 1